MFQSEEQNCFHLHMFSLWYFHLLAIIIIMLLLLLYSHIDIWPLFGPNYVALQTSIANLDIVFLFIYLIFLIKEIAIRFFSSNFSALIRLCFYCFYSLCVRKKRRFTGSSLQWCLVASRPSFTMEVLSPAFARIEICEYLCYATLKRVLYVRD